MRSESSRVFDEDERVHVEESTMKNEDHCVENSVGKDDPRNGLNHQLTDEEK